MISIIGFSQVKYTPNYVINYLTNNAEVFLILKIMDGHS